MALKCWRLPPMDDLRQQWPEPGCWPAGFLKTMVCWGCSVSRAQKTWLWSLLFKVFHLQGCNYAHGHARGRKWVLMRGQWYQYNTTEFLHFFVISYQIRNLKQLTGININIKYIVEINIVEINLFPNDCISIVTVLCCLQVHLQSFVPTFQNNRWCVIYSLSLLNWWQILEAFDFTQTILCFALTLKNLRHVIFSCSVIKSNIFSLFYIT